MTPQHPILESLAGLARRRETGSLLLEQGKRYIQIHLQDGEITACSSNLENEHLGQYLLRECILEQTALTKILKQVRSRQTPLGELVVQQGLLTPFQLGQVLRRQTLSLVTRSLKGFEVRHFTSDLKTHRMAMPVSVGELLLCLTRKEQRSLELAPDEQVCLRDPEKIPSVPWTPEEVSLLSRLHTPWGLESLVSSTSLSQSRVQEMLALLQTLGLLEITAEQSDQERALVDQRSLPLDLLVPEIQSPVSDPRLEVSRNPYSLISEQFASLKVMVDGRQTEGIETQIIAISSADARDGKSLVCANLALSFAQDPDRRVAVLDCDLRNPSLHDYLGIPLGPGLIDYHRHDNLEPYCFMRRIGSLFVMTAGGYAENPIGYLSHRRMVPLMQFLRRHFDTVLIDTPPLQPISDTRVVARLADEMLLVIRRGRTPYRLVETAFRNVDPSKLMGVVLNDVEPGRFSSVYEYNHSRYGRAGKSPYLPTIENTGGGSGKPANR